MATLALRAPATYPLHFPEGGVKILVSRSPQLRFFAQVALAVTLLFLVFLGVLTVYLDSGQDEEKAMEAASRLPGQFVADCQKVSEESGVPWYYLAAYYQISFEKAGNEGVYPSKNTIRELSDKINACQSSGFKEKLKELEGKRRAGSIIKGAKLLEQGGKLFSSDYVFPVEESKMWFKDTWLASREDGKRQHFGTDIFAPEGTPVYACTSGSISRIGWDELGGKRIGLVGGDEIYYYYAHLDSYAPGLKKGSPISRGQLLGTVGHTGNAAGTPDHLHFGILQNWETWVNPYNFLVFWELQQEK